MKMTLKEFEKRLQIAKNAYNFDEDKAEVQMDVGSDEDILAIRQQIDENNAIVVLIGNSNGFTVVE